ncbi:MAG TPA: hypothetical protein VF634_08955 [Pyrinomonadaceae bacterium]|jgi:hypothetical protein
MKKLRFSLIFATLFLTLAVGVQAQTSASAFTGPWVLDRQKTSAKDFPQKLQNYKMLVAESENMLKVQSQVEGRVEVETSRDRARDVGPNVTPNSVGAPLGQAAGGGGGPATSKTSYSGTLALTFTPGQFVYDLSGKEIKVEIMRGEKVNGYARIKAKLDKSGKSLQLSTIRREKMAYGEMETNIWESWKLSEDGKSLKFTRTVETPTVRDELTMFLTRPAQ